VLWYANNEAQDRGQAPPVVYVPDGDTYINDPHFLEPVLADSEAGNYWSFRAEAFQSRFAGFPIAFTVRPFDKWSAEAFVGTHGDVVRTRGTPVGVQEPAAYSTRAVFRPQPQAWDAGFYGR
jgi:hypothetical protein